MTRLTLITIVWLDVDSRLGAAASGLGSKAKDDVLVRRLAGASSCE